MHGLSKTNLSSSGSESSLLLALLTASAFRKAPIGHRVKPEGLSSSYPAVEIVDRRQIAEALSGLFGRDVALGRAE
jgi:hypothetical protein